MIFSKKIIMRYYLYFLQQSQVADAAYLRHKIKNPMPVNMEFCRLLQLALSYSCFINSCSVAKRRIEFPSLP